MLCRSLVLAAVMAGVLGLAMGVQGDPAGTQPAPVTVTVEDNEKAVQVAVGQEIVVSLEGKEAKTGWEAGGGEGTSVKPVKGGGRAGKFELAALEFTPAKDAADESIGTYTYRYKAVAAGKTTLEYSYVMPGGPKPTPRSATALVAKMKAVIEVVERK